MLQAKDLALLSNRLQTPVITSNILGGQEALSDDVRYGLHDLISDQQPDTALLSIALSAKTIATRFKDQSPNLNILSMECDRIIEEYGEIWLQNAQNQYIDESTVFDVLLNTAEDLEGLAELLDYNHQSLSHINEEASELCDILHVQAKAHALIAEEFLSLADQALVKEFEDNNYTEVFTNNVIPFPTTRA